MACFKINFQIDHSVSTEENDLILTCIVYKYTIQDINSTYIYNDIKSNLWYYIKSVDYFMEK